MSSSHNLTIHDTNNITWKIQNIQSDRMKSKRRVSECSCHLSKESTSNQMWLSMKLCWSWYIAIILKFISSWQCMAQKAQSVIEQVPKVSTISNDRLQRAMKECCHQGNNIRCNYSKHIVNMDKLAEELLRWRRLWHVFVMTSYAPDIVLHTLSSDNTYPCELKISLVHMTSSFPLKQ